MCAAASDDRIRGATTCVSEMQTGKRKKNISADQSWLARAEAKTDFYAQMCFSKIQIALLNVTSVIAYQPQNL